MTIKTTLILLGMLLVGLMILLGIRQNIGETMFIGLSLLTLGAAGKYIVRGME